MFFWKGAVSKETVVEREREGEWHSLAQLSSHKSLTTYRVSLRTGESAGCSGEGKICKIYWKANGVSWCSKYTISTSRTHCVLWSNKIYECLLVTYATPFVLKPRNKYTCFRVEKLCYWIAKAVGMTSKIWNKFDLRTLNICLHPKLRVSSSCYSWDLEVQQQERQTYGQTDRQIDEQTDRLDSATDPEQEYIYFLGPRLLLLVTYYTFVQRIVY